MSDITEVKAAIEGIGKAFEELKSTNDAKIKAEVKGAVDPLIEEKMKKINDDLDKLSEFKQAYERDIARSYKMANGGEMETPEQKAHSAAFMNYAKKGIEPNQAEFKAMSVGSESDGGILVPRQVSARIVQHIFDRSPIRQLAAVESISSDALEVMLDLQELEANWVSETQARPDTSTPKLGMKTIPVHEMYAQPKATQKLLDDSAVNIETWLATKVADKFARKEQEAFVNGDGAGKPKGVLAYANGTGAEQIGTVPSGGSGVITADGVINLLYALKSEFVTQSTFLMNRAIVRETRKLKENTTNAYIWQPGLQAGEPDRLVGRPVAQDDFMPSVTANGTKVMALAAWREAYQIVDRLGIRTLRDPYTDKPFIKFYTTRRVGGDVVNFQSIKLMVAGAS